MSQASIIEELPINIYGINAFINKFYGKDDILDLEVIKNNFDIDFKFDEETNQIQETKFPAFTQLTFNERIISSGTGYSTSFNKPPLGPIENYCYCSYCGNIGPMYHNQKCPFPEKKSLFLTVEGIFYYIIQNSKTIFPENINTLKNSWLEKRISQSELNKFLLIPNSVKIKSGSNIELTNALTKIQYFDVVKLRGPTKLEYTTATQKFSNAIMITFEYLVNEDIKKTSIRIYKNGLINLINIPYSNKDRKYLYTSLINKINECGETAIYIDNFNKLASEFTEEEYDEYEIIEDASYIHSVNSQFNLWSVKEKFSIDFNKLNELISPFNSSGKIVSGTFTNIINVPSTNRQIINLTDGKNTIKIINWEHSLGKDTRNQSLTREEIKCVILPIDGIKISLQIHKHGTFQMSMSYCNSYDLKNSICTKILDKSDVELDFKYFNIIQGIFINIFKLKSNLYNSSLDYSEESIGIIRNTVSGNAPPSKPGTSTAVCRSSDPRPGYPGLRPTPYSFNGNCPESRQFINPIGVLGNDGLYYPCCSAKTKSSDEEYKKYLLNGLPKDSEEAIKYGITPENDFKSGILIPGSINIGAFTEAFINDTWTPIEIMGYVGKSKKPQEFLVRNLKTNVVIRVNRQYLKRDSRYFPGLKSLTKEQLIKCIIKNVFKNKKSQSIYELENLTKIKSLINIPNINFNPILSVYDLNLFEKINYFVTSVPNNSNLFYLYISKSESYFINIYGNKKEKSFSEDIDENIILLGFLEVESEKFYVIDILYFINKPVQEPFSEKINILKGIEETYFLTDNSIEFSTFNSNIIKSSKDLLQENSNILLVYIPNQNYLNFKIWGQINIEPEITLQIIKKVKTNYYKLGYENTLLNGLSISFDNIFIPKEFIDSNQIMINDYILFKVDFNLQTGQLSTRILTPIEKTEKSSLTLHETLVKLSLLINPIKESFFINNRLETDYIWSIPVTDKILKFVSDETPLIEYS